LPAPGLRDPSEEDTVTRHPGRGVSGSVAGRETIVGSAALFEAAEWTVPDPVANRAAAVPKAGRVPALIGWSGSAIGGLVLLDAVLVNPPEGPKSGEPIA